MDFKAYNRLNNIIGWLVFAIAAFTYLSTMEWTVSLWDCGEFVPSSYKLQICHPPGAPFFVLINRVFTMFAGSNLKMVPLLVNASSAMASAFTILFLFWSISALCLKIANKSLEGIDKGTAFAIFGSAIVGGLAYTFSDTFWFSAVEGEVYALSSMFTALIFWLALKWEARADEPYHLKWMVLIFYMIGIVIGVHLLGLLVIPVVIIMYYFKKNEKITVKGTAIAFGIGVVALAVVQYGIIQYLLKIGQKFDLVFVGAGLPLWSGVLFFFGLFFAALAYGIMWSHKKKRVFLNLALVSVAVVTIGFGSYAITIVRSFSNPPIDMNDPEDPFSMFSYLAREQYGDNYLLTGPYYPAFDSQEYYDAAADGPMQYRRVKDSVGNSTYLETGNKITRSFKGKMSTFFPRLYSPQDNHKQGYRYWCQIPSYYNQEAGREVYEDENPDFSFSFVKHNLSFFFRYQINYMYWRYFMWNFVGRQNDLQGTQHEFHQGNWITGISAIDEAFGRGKQSNLPKYLAENKARNKLYGLPFILGIIGLLYQYKKSKKDLFIVALFFFMTGLAIEIYLNMPNPQPRERDYAFVGSFYVYAIWIGMGVMAIWDYINNARKNQGSPMTAIAVTIGCLIAVPTLMASVEWDDHDRSHRYTTLDYGADYLYSCAPNAILFCNGDNDTYPLWYAQEVENIRPDIRIINLSLLSTDWYIDEMRKKTFNGAPALTFTLNKEQVYGWDYAFYEPSLAAKFDQNSYVPVSTVINFIGDINQRPEQAMGERIPFVPTKKMFIPVDRAEVIKNGTVNPKYANLIVDSMKIDMGRNMIKSDVMVLDFISTNKFRNPIYFSITSGPGEYLGLGKYLIQEGLTYRLVPYVSPVGQYDGQDTRVNLDVMYDNVMNKFKFGDIADRTVLIDYVTGRQCNNMRGVISRLAKNLALEGRNADAIKVLDKGMKEIPEKNVPLDFYVVQIVEAYYRAGATQKANDLALKLNAVLSEELDYYAAEPINRQQNDARYDIQRNMYGVQSLGKLAKEFKQDQVASKVEAKFSGFDQKFAWLRQGQAQ